MTAQPTLPVGLASRPMSIADLRRDYARARLDEADVSHDPLVEFARWFAEAQEAQVPEPNAMTLATATADGVPSARIVLLKGFDQRGFVFFTDYRSRKGAELEANPRAALVFWWGELERQVRITGGVALDLARGVGALLQDPAARQPAGRMGVAPEPGDPGAGGAGERPARGRGSGSATGDVPLPPHWGGYRVVPDTIEFWQGRESRLHDRIRYVRESGGRGGGWSGCRREPPLAYACPRLAGARRRPALAVQSSEGPHPNIVVFVADDLGWRDSGPYGNGAIGTPHIAALARSGLLVQRAFGTYAAVQPIPHQHPQRQVPHATRTEDLHTPLPASERMLPVPPGPRLLHRHMAKTHYGPNAEAQFQWYSPETAPALPAFLDSAGTQPFFLWVGFHEPHRPYARGLIPQPHSPAQVALTPYLADTPRYTSRPRAVLRRDRAHGRDRSAA